MNDPVAAALTAIAYAERTQARKETTSVEVYSVYELELPKESKQWQAPLI